MCVCNSRMIELRTFEDVLFQYLSADAHPDHGPRPRSTLELVTVVEVVPNHRNNSVGVGFIMPQASRLPGGLLASGAPSMDAPE